MGLTVKYYGVRGSIPVSGPDKIKFGGNTTCVFVRCGDEKFIIDSGTGIRTLGADLLNDGFAPDDNGSARILYTHTHWDHIQGLPFFAPAYIPTNRFEIYGEKKKIMSMDENGNQRPEEWSIQRALMMQQHFMYFPVDLNIISPGVSFHDIEAGQNFTFGDVSLKTLKMRHPNETVGYRFEYNNRVFVYATDVEHIGDMSEQLIEFARGADVLAYDSQYTPEEYEAGKKGWGHSTYEVGADICERAGIPVYHLIHHDPAHSDEVLEKLEKKARERHRESYLIPEKFEFTLD